MTKSVFLDSDILLDAILERPPFSVDAIALLAAIENGRYTGSTSALCLSNIYYIIRKIKGHADAISTLVRLRALLAVLPLTDREIGESIAAGFSDFEDGIQHYIALNHQIKFLITRNKKDFRNTKLKILSAKEFLLLI